MVREICKVFTIAQHAASSVHLFPSFPPLEMRGAAKLARKYGWVATRDINVQKLESQFTPHTLTEFSSSSLLLSVSPDGTRQRRKLLRGYWELFGLIKPAWLVRRRRWNVKKLVSWNVSIFPAKKRRYRLCFQQDVTRFVVDSWA